MQVVEQLQQLEPDGRGRYIQELHDTCKMRWRWAMPESDGDKRLLARLCRDMLPLEIRIADLAMEHV